MATVWRSQYAFARLFIGKTRQILNNSTDIGAKFTPNLLLICSREYSNYAQSPFVDRIKEQYKFDVVKNPPEWEYVQRLLPFETIPQITPKEKYPSGFLPPKEEAKNLPYFIPRTKNHELPIYLGITFRGQRRISNIRKIEGDIWMMNDAVKSFLRKEAGRYVETRVHELGRFIEVKGDYVANLQQWAYSKGF